MLHQPTQLEQDERLAPGTQGSSMSLRGDHISHEERRAIFQAFGVAFQVRHCLGACLQSTGVLHRTTTRPELPVAALIFLLCMRN